jgi:hypothetical protein
MKKEIINLEGANRELDECGYNYGLTFKNTHMYAGYFHEKIVCMEIRNKNDFLDYVKEIMKWVSSSYKNQKTRESIYYSRFCYHYLLKGEIKEGDFGYCTRKASTWDTMGNNLIANLKQLYKTFDRYEYINIYRIEFVNRSEK